jgi:uncharacterized protein (TIGR02147 family)
LTKEGIQKFAAALKLNKEETEFFEKLVAFNQSNVADERAQLAQEMIRQRGYRRLKPLSEAQFNILARWYLLPIREMPNLIGFNADPTWIAGRTQPKISPAEAKKALDELLELGLIERAADGTIIQTSTDVSTGDEILSSAAITYHKENLKLAGDSIAAIPKQQRDLSVMTLGVSKESMKKVKEKIQEFRKEIVGMLAQEPQTTDAIYQLNIQFFPVAPLRNDGESDE